MAGDDAQGVVALAPDSALAMVTNGLSQVTGDDADTTRKALAKGVGSRDLTRHQRVVGPASGHGDQWPEPGDGGRRRHDPEGAGQRGALGRP